MFGSLRGKMYFCELKRKIVMEQVNIWIYKHQAWLVALGWVLLLSLFTYTELFCNALRIDKQFDIVYQISQSKVLALVVNLGLLCMLVFDYMNANKAFTNKIVGGILGAIMFPVLLYSISTMQVSEDAVNYVWWFRSPCLLYILHALFIVALTWLKKESLIEENNVRNVKKEF